MVCTLNISSGGGGGSSSAGANSAATGREAAAARISGSSCLRTNLSSLAAEAAAAASTGALEHLGVLDMSSATAAAEHHGGGQQRRPAPPLHPPPAAHHHPGLNHHPGAQGHAEHSHHHHTVQQSEHSQMDERSSSAGSSLGSCSPPPQLAPQSPHSPPASAVARPPWLHEFTSPHVLQFLNLNAAAAGASMLAASQPLAALHSMAERSHQHHLQQQQQQQQQQQSSPTAQQQQQHQQQQQQNLQGQSSPTGSGKHSPATSITSVGSNPHGIDTILSRPAATHPNSGPGIGQGQHGIAGSPHGQHLPPAPRYAMHAGFAASTGIGQFQQRAEPRHPAVYWPGLQGLVSDPLAWRARLHSLSQQLGCQQQAMSGGGSGSGGEHEPGKKKHTRPTFSGQQIFALEKTFEQTKYLAGPERAKLAYALGMSESQVKVWFQNRRTKWRKKHAAEMATAKRRQEEVEGVVGEAEDGCSDGETSEAGSASGGNNNANSGNQETAAKRLRRELEQQYGPCAQ